MHLVRSLSPVLVALLVALAVAGCRTSKKENTFNYDPAAHQKASELKSKAQAVMVRAGSSYSGNRADAEALTVEIREAGATAAGKPDNEAVAAEWVAMADPSGVLYGGFVARWQARGTIDEATREAMIDTVTARFDYILCLEAAKRVRGARCTPPGAEAPGAPPGGATLPAPPPA